MSKDYILTPNGELCNEDELRHYGIPGMKWGVRRYQDKGGRLTAAGKARYDDDDDYGTGSYVKTGKAYVGKFLRKSPETMDDFRNRFGLELEGNRFQERLRSNGDTYKPGLFSPESNNSKRSNFANTNTSFFDRYEGSRNLEKYYDDLLSRYIDGED